MTALGAIVVKELRLLLRDPGGLLLLFVLPAVFITVLSVALRGAFSSDRTEDRLAMVVVDEDDGDVAEQIAENVEASGLFHIVGGGDAEGITYDEARQGIADGLWDVVVRVPRGADEARSLERDATVEVLVDPVVSTEVARAAESTVGNAILRTSLGTLRDGLEDAREAGTEAAREAKRAARSARKAAWQAHKCQSSLKKLPPFLYRRIAHKIPSDGGLAVALDADADAATDGGGDADADADAGVTADADVDGDGDADEPSFDGLGVEYGYLTGGTQSIRPTSVQQNVPGWTIFALFWLAQILAINVLNERESGIHTRILAAPISMPVYLVGKIIPFFFINILQAISMFAVGVLLLPHLGCPQLVITNVPALALVTAAISFVSVSFGLLMSQVGKSSFFVASVTAALLIIMTVIGGIMVPKYIMPESLQRLSMVVPHGWALEGYLTVLVRGGGLADVVGHVAVLLAFGAAAFGAAIARMRLARS